MSKRCIIEKTEQVGKSGFRGKSNMARESYFVLDCSLYSNSIAEIIVAFNQIGWGYSNNRKEFLPLHDDDVFNWESQPLSVNELLSIISD